MQQPEPLNPNYHHIAQGFADWLSLLGYADTTVHSLPVHIWELLQYLQQRNIHHISQVLPRHITAFVQHLRQRTNKTYGGGLSSNYINKSIHAINTFGRYLGQTGKYHTDLNVHGLSDDTAERTILSKTQIQQLYDSTFEPYPHNSTATGQRDRAIIAIFYGCGLRRTEGINLNLYDINSPKSLLFVRKGKGNKQRHVPIARKHLEDLKTYITDGRRWFMEAHDTGHYQHQRYGTHFKKKQHTDDEAFFINHNGKRMQDFSYRLQQMKQRAGIGQDFSLHHLRHSIATHLLQSGMDIKEIARFLGHSSLDSTQIYTHIAEQQNRQQYESL